VISLLKNEVGMKKNVLLSSPVVMAQLTVGVVAQAQQAEKILWIRIPN
jgi:hypothetical protein